MKKTVFIGSVISSKIALETLIKNNVNIGLVCSLDEDYSTQVSDYFPIHQIAEQNGIPYIKFGKINTTRVKEKIKSLNPDFIFVIGLSQMIPQEILHMASNYTVGFHPTALPKYRGRAAIPWQIILGVKASKVSLFKLDSGMDSGDIISQFPYQIESSDYALDVYKKICEAMVNALNESLPKMYNETLELKSQNHDDASYLMVRRPEDGMINWNKPVKYIETLIRATSKPYPGAFSNYKGVKVIIWKARILENYKYIGFPGQIVMINKNEIGVLTNKDILIIEEYELECDDIVFAIGHKFE
jgi:methionyl-tRNA formyltransferase